MKESNTPIDLGIPQGLRPGRQPLHLDRFESASAATTGPLQAFEPLLDVTWIPIPSRREVNAESVKAKTARLLPASPGNAVRVFDS